MGWNLVFRGSFLSLYPCFPHVFPSHSFKLPLLSQPRLRISFKDSFPSWQTESAALKSQCEKTKLTTQQAFPRSAIFTLSLSAFLGSRGLRRKFPAADFPRGNVYNSWLKLQRQCHHLSPKSYHPLPSQEVFLMDQNCSLPDAWV